jgi:hypothetical protein
MSAGLKVLNMIKEHEVIYMLAFAVMVSVLLAEMVDGGDRIFHEE